MFVIVSQTNLCFVGAFRTVNIYKRTEYTYLVSNYKYYKNNPSILFRIRIIFAVKLVIYVYPFCF